MKKLTTPERVFGPYQTIETLVDRYRCDGADLPFTVVGKGLIEDASPDDFPPPPVDVVALKATIADATQERLDAFARTRNYDGILSASTYAVSTNAKFAAEGQYCVNARDATWATLYAILAEVEAGTRPIPTSFADIEPDLPILEWPVK
jgi:hypothetical protein